MTVSIITPWLNHSELIRTYEPSVTGAQVIIVDNGSAPEHAEQIAAMVARLDGVYIRNETNAGFAHANNQGLAAATGDVILFLNNDIEAPSKWLDWVERDTQPGALYGPHKLNKYGLDYLEGFCIAARPDVWQRLGGWPDDLPGLYWEDNVLCLRAMQAGIRLVETNWPVFHFSNYTSRQTPGAYDHSAGNQAAFERMVSEWRSR